MIKAKEISLYSFSYSYFIVLYEWNKRVAVENHRRQTEWLIKTREGALKFGLGKFPICQFDFRSYFGYGAHLHVRGDEPPDFC